MLRGLRVYPYATRVIVNKPNQGMFLMRNCKFDSSLHFQCSISVLPPLRDVDNHDKFKSSQETSDKPQEARNEQVGKDVFQDDVPKIKAKKSYSGPLSFKRRRYMAPGSRIASLLPQHYWQAVGEDQKVIEKAAGKVHDELDTGGVNKYHDDATSQLVLSDSLNDGGERSSNECKPVLISPETIAIHPANNNVGENGDKIKSVFTSKLERRGKLGVSSRLIQMMEKSNQLHENSSDGKEENTSDHQKNKKDVE